MKNTTGMNAYKQSAQTGGYTQAPTPGSPRYTESWALIEAARRMAKAIEEYAHCDVSLPKSREILREPLRLNWRLWTIFQAELINGMDQADDTMAPEIRTNMLTLCQFIDKHTTQALADPTPERLAVLIDINRNIASGHLENAAAINEEQAAQEGEKAFEPAETSSAQPESPSDDKPLSGFSEEV